MTTIQTAYPPNIAQIRAAFRITGAEIFAWGGVIYNPSGNPLSRSLIEHEKVHFRQQEEHGGPSAWWDRYISDRAFRLDAEMEATIVEFRVYSEDNGRPARRRHLDLLAKRLSSPMYGGMITRKAAKVRIKSGAIQALNEGRKP